MAGLLDKPTQSPGAPAPAAAPPPPPVDEHVAAPDDASRLCGTCAALLADGQDWCLECGAAQPGRLGTRPGWRPALTIVALTAVLAVGAVAAAYAALSSDAERRASAPPPPSAQPVVPAPPVQTTPAPAETTPTVPAPKDEGAKPPPAPPKDDAAGDPAPAPAAPTPPPASSPAPSGDAGGESSGGSKPKDDEPASPVVALGPDAASTYDPFDRSGGMTGDPADAIDGRSKTAWEAPVGQDGLVNIGLLVSLEEAQAFDSVRVQAGTPGFSVTLYGAKTATPPEGDPAASSLWRKLDETRDFGTDEKLSGGVGKYRHVLLWFTEQPADTKVMIPEVELLK